MPFNKGIDLSHLTPEEKKARQKQQQKEWYQKHKEEIKQKQLKYYYDNEVRVSDFRKYREFYEEWHDKVPLMQKVL